MKTALKLFVAYGVQKVSTAAIAKEAGTASGTLFLYFPTKQKLIDELVLGIGKEQSQYIKSMIEPTQPAREAFWTIWKESILWILDHKEAFQYIKQIRDSGIISAGVVRESDAYFDYYYRAIEKGLKEGRIKPYPVELIGTMLYQAIVGVMDLVIATPNSSYQENCIRIGFDIFWDGIKTGKD